jgi:hypothetical protein
VRNIDRALPILSSAVPSVDCVSHLDLRNLQTPNLAF